MGTLGKILLFVNFLAFAGLCYAATQDWSARNAAAANALRHQLAIVGLPVEAPAGIDGDEDAVPLGISISGGVPIETARPKLLEEHFAGTASEEYSSGKFSRTQLGEVDETAKKLFAKLSAMSAGEKLKFLCGTFIAGRTGGVVFVPGILTVMAETYAERTAVRQLGEPTQFVRQPAKMEANAKRAEEILAKRFEALKKVDPRQADTDAAAVKEASETLRKVNDEAKRKYEVYSKVINDAASESAARDAAVKDAGDALDKLGEAYAKFQAVLADMNKSACRDEGDRRKRIAHLLMHLSESAGWQKRVALTVGLRTYLSTLSDHVNRFGKLAAASEQQVVLDQARFADEYELLKTLAVGQSLLLTRQISVRTEYQSQRRNDEEAVRLRLQLLEERRKTLAAVEAEVQSALAVQAETEKRLFTVQKLVGETLRRNFELEANLEKAEK